MCLYTTQKNSKMAEQDIYCYKIVVKTNLPYEFASYYRGFIYRIGRTYKHTFGQGIHKRKSIYPNLYEIHGGMFHSYRSIPAPTCQPVLVCIIPKGTKYYEGVNNDYCSREIKIVGVL